MKKRFVRDVRLCPSTSSGRTDLETAFGAASFVNAWGIASLKTVRAEPVEACSRRERDAESTSASLACVRLCPSMLRLSSASGRTVLFADSGIVTIYSGIATIPGTAHV